MKLTRLFLFTGLALSIAATSVRAGGGLGQLAGDAIVLQIQGICYLNGGKGTPVEPVKLDTADLIGFCTESPNSQVVFDLTDSEVKVVDQCGFISCTLFQASKVESCSEGAVFKGSKATFQQVCVFVIDGLDVFGNGAAKQELTLQYDQDDNLKKTSYECTVNMILDGVPCCATLKGKKLFQIDPNGCF